MVRLQMAIVTVLQATSKALKLSSVDFDKPYSFPISFVMISDAALSFVYVVLFRVNYVVDSWFSSQKIGSEYDIAIS